ncbi:hypothetical protein SAMN06296241_1862 [Salinimicrobium sediminis]|uniref:Uncharacterized protein n=1 Tax=Salinimicrobium sediminis TaxID=1343891 RepID=A0A285X698_9FLAO|nr:hypothetical protein [Salinimicrobium sediminis]SOC80314.1 hypothetical protein SAMN06296241_1862 [Salinimicrobium sediminis]
MRKIYLLLMVALVYSCSVEDDSYLEYGDNYAFTASVEADACTISAGADKSTTITVAQAEAIPSWDEVRKLYLSLLDEGVSRNGEFDPAIWDLIDAFNENPLGEFTTIYTVTEGDCSDSVILTINVVESLPSDPTCELSAGDDASKTITKSEADAIPSWDEVRKLYLSLLEAGVARNGEFDPSIWDLINSYTGPGEYSTTYTITEGDCADSVELTIVVVADGSSDPTCNLNAGADASKTITKSEADAIPSWDEVRKLYLSLLEEGISKNGEFHPSIWDLINSYTGPGTYTTTYTISEGECTDSVELTIYVVADQSSDPGCDLILKTESSKSISYSEAEAIPSWDEVRKLYLSLLPQGVSRSGSFDPSIWDLINDFNERGVGSYTTTYTVVEGDCSDSIELTIHVTPDN